MTGYRLELTMPSQVKNALVDNISRLQFHKFRAMAPEAAEQPTPVPDHLWNIFNLAPESY